MIAQTQGILSNIKALVSSHPIGLGVIIGVGAYYVVNKYWLNEDEDEEINMAEESESEEDAPA
ncbi:MAG: hypothetical protein KZQ83_05385 [gamma proteobacterium symbiont of Taylorina sp.]|nr:hypothetical protein [gamma proteobacterium symbiont of Taylorina sp.]